MKCLCELRVLCMKAELLLVLLGLAIAWNVCHRKVQLTVDLEVIDHMLVEEIPPHTPYIHILRKCKSLFPRKEWEVILRIPTKRPIERPIG